MLRNSEGSFTLLPFKITLFLLPLNTRKIMKIATHIISVIRNTQNKVVNTAVTSVAYCYIQLLLKLLSVNRLPITKQRREISQ